MDEGATDGRSSMVKQEAGAWCTNTSPRGWCSFFRPLLKLGLEHHQPKKVHPSRDVNFIDSSSASTLTQRFEPMNLTYERV